jgi:hypothetical protein
MMPSMPKRLFRLAAVVLSMFWSMAASTVRAATLPAGAEVHAGRCVEASSFRQLVERRYQVEFGNVVATDLDSDGDIDVLATTDKTFTVWVNDGQGHLTSQRLPTGPAIDSRPSPNAFDGQDDRSNPSINTDVPTTAVLVERAHAPPIAASGGASLDRQSAPSSSLVRSSAPRGPPLD